MHRQKSETDGLSRPGWGAKAATMKSVCVWPHVESVSSSELGVVRHPNPTRRTCVDHTVEICSESLGVVRACARHPNPTRRRFFYRAKSDALACRRTHRGLTVWCFLLRLKQEDDTRNRRQGGAAPSAGWSEAPSGADLGCSSE